MRLNPLTFTSFKVEENPQGFVDEVEKIFRVMHATDSEGVEFTVYKLKDVAYHFYEEWEQLRGYDAAPTLWVEFSGAFLDHIFPQELRKVKAEKFVNLKKGKMSVKEYSLKFQQLSHCAIELVFN